MKIPFTQLLILLLSIISLAGVHADTVWLDDLGLSTVTQDWNKPRANQSVGGNPMKIGGKVFQRGVGTQARCWFPISLSGGGLSFTGSVGMDDEGIGKASSSVEFIVQGDGKELWKSGAMRTGEPAREFLINLAGVKTVVLEVTNSGDKNQYDHADWVNAKFETVAGQPLTTLADSKPGWTQIEKGAALTRLWRRDGSPKDFRWTSHSKPGGKDENYGLLAFRIAPSSNEGDRSSKCLLATAQRHAAGEG